MNPESTTAEIPATDCAAEPAQRGWKKAGVCVALIALVWIVFGQTARFGFVNFDDPQYITQNPIILQGLSLANIKWAFTNVLVGHWHPLTTLLLMAQAQLFGTWAGGYHIINVSLHTACVVFLFLALSELTGAMWRSAFAAAIFAIHPLRAESVVWISECKDVLSGVFFMLSLWAYVRYVRRLGAARYIMILIWFALGLMSKPMLVTLPCVLLLLDYWPLGRLQSFAQFPRLFWEKIPLFILTALSSLAAILSLNSGTHPPIKSYPANAPIAYVAYLSKSIYPVHLALPYPLPQGGPPLWETFNSILLLAVLTCGVWFLRRRQPFLLTGWLWYLGMLVPVIGVMQTGEQAYADRYTYLPQIGLCIAATWFAADWAGEGKRRRTILGCVSGFVLCAVAAAGWHQVNYWRDEVILWTHSIESTHDNVGAYLDLGNTLYQRGRKDDAIAAYREAVRLNPDNADAHDNLGNALIDQGQTAQGIFEFRQALLIDPGDAAAHNNLGNALLHQGHMAEAESEFREAIQDDPGDSMAHYNLGAALFQQGRDQDAADEFRQSLRLDPFYADAHNDLAGIFVKEGHDDDALAEYREAVRLKPDYAEARNNFGFLLLQKGQTGEAIAQLRAALQLDPALALAHGSLATALSQQGRAAEAIPEYRAFLRLVPGNPTAQNALAWLLATAPEQSLRDGAAAVALAKNANHSTGGLNPNILRTLAAAYAQSGDFPNALQTAQDGLQLAIAQSNPALASALRGDIASYQAHQPIH